MIIYLKMQFIPVMGKAEFPAAITSIFSVKWSFRNILICLLNKSTGDLIGNTESAVKLLNILVIQYVRCWIVRLAIDVKWDCVP